MMVTIGEFVKIEGTRVSVNANGLAEAKLALKELKLKKKEFGIQKKIIIARQKEIRAAYTDEVRTRGSMIRGGGGIGKFFRAIQTISRDSKRSNLAADLAPLEKAKQEVEATIYAIEHVILQIESQILKQN